MNKYNISIRDAVVMLAAVVLQAVTAIWAKDDMISFISGMAGIISVVLCSQKKLTFYLFGFIQLATYLVVVTRERLWGEFAENIFYAVTMIAGIFIWLNNYNKAKYEVTPRELSFKANVLIGMLFLFGTLALAFCLDIYTDDAYPWLDSISTVPAFIAQLLMIFGFREQWRYWLIVDVTSIVMWAVIGNPCMVMQFSLWTLNCIYGMYKWKEDSILI